MPAQQAAEDVALSVSQRAEPTGGLLGPLPVFFAQVVFPVAAAALVRWLDAGGARPGPISDDALSTGLPPDDEPAPEAAASQSLPADRPEDPDTILWRALSASPAEGVPFGELITATRMSRRWVFYRLRRLEADGHAIQMMHGYWRVN